METAPFMLDSRTRAYGSANESFFSDIDKILGMLTAFDAKEYTRSKGGELKFYTPLGCGINISKVEEFASIYSEKLIELSKNFGIEKCCGAFSPAEYYRKIGPGKTIRMSDELLKSVQDLIEVAYFSYVVLPPRDVPIIEVGGYGSPKKPLGTFDFLRRLSVYFSYITAWNYLGVEGREEESIIIDGFQGKRTPAWDDITSKLSPIIYVHGDECNPFISIADIIAFLTDKKLYDNFFHLEPRYIEEVWKPYSFKTDTHFIDRRILSKIKWYSNEPIDLTSYYARPIIFLKADGFKTEEIKKLDVYPEATLYAKERKGCLQGYDEHIDSPKVKDGDFFVYAGEKSRQIALTLSDMYSIEILSFRELREKNKAP